MGLEKQLKLPGRPCGRRFGRLVRPIRMLLPVHMYQELKHARLIVRDNSDTLIILMDMENHTVAASIGALAIDEVSDVATSLPRTACVFGTDPSH